MSQSKKPVDEEKTAAASYIIQFYQEVAQLKHSYAQYVNLLIEMQQSTSDESPGLNQQQKNAINQSVQAVRYYIIQTNITAQNILTHLKKEEEGKALEKLYLTVTEKYMIDRKDLHEYVKLISLTLMAEAMRGLLQSSKDILKDLYNEE